MVSKSARIAYLKRMLERLEDEDARTRQRILVEGMSEEAGKLVMQQLRNSREELLDELRTLQGEAER